MAFYLNGKKLRPGKPFTDAAGNQYAGNFLTVSTPEQRASIGIVEKADLNNPNEPQYRFDSKFWFSYDTPRHLEDVVEIDEETGEEVVVANGIKKHYIAEQSKIAATLLQPTDWYTARFIDSGTPIPQEVIDYRQAVRAVCDERQQLIELVESTPELEELIKATPQIQVEDGQVIDNPDVFLPVWPEVVS